MSIGFDTILRRGDDMLHAPVGEEEVVVLSVTAGNYYGLNAVGARIWELLETPRSIGQLCAVLCEEFEVEPDACRDAVLTFAIELVRSGVAHAAAV